MKQLYVTLNDKEEELREFIRNYEQRTRDSNEVIKQLSREKETAEHERDILSKAKEATEKAVQLKTQLENKDVEAKELEVFSEYLCSYSPQNFLLIVCDYFV